MTHHRATTRDIYRQFSDGEIPCKHVYEDLFLTDFYDPYTTDGHAKIQWAEHQIKAALGFSESRTSSKKNLKQITGIKDASEMNAWLNGLLCAIQSCEKACATIRSEKWESKSRLTLSGALLTNLIDARKLFISRTQSINPKLLTETEFDLKTKNYPHAR